MPKLSRARPRMPPPPNLARLGAQPQLDARPRDPHPPAPSGRRPTYPEAVARFEAGMRRMQEHQFGEALEAFESVLSLYPEERELNERVRVYVAACRRQLNTAAAEPRNTDERIYAATLALNAGDVDGAMRHLEAVVAEDGRHDGALYMLAVSHALRQDSARAVECLRRAIECNPDNRHLALQDSDLERLLQDEAIRATIGQAGAPSGASARRQRPTR